MSILRHTKKYVARQCEYVPVCFTCIVGMACSKLNNKKNQSNNTITKNTSFVRVNWYDMCCNPLRIMLKNNLEKNIFNYVPPMDCYQNHNFCQVGIILLPRNPHICVCLLRKYFIKSCQISVHKGHHDQCRCVLGDGGSHS